MGGFQPSEAASQVSYMADKTIRPVPRPRPTPRSTLSNMPRHTVGFPSDLAIPARLGDAMLTPAGGRTHLPTTGPGHGRAVQGQRKVPALRDIPKSMCYDGRSTWQSFEMKFVQYANAYEWTEEDCKVCLLHCLSGKALDYCTRLMRAQADLPYDTLLRKLQERFRAELQASAQAKFNLATQTRSETMEDWADRVQELALEAFIGLPEHYANSQSIARFCQGLNDMDAGHSAFMKNHDTIEKAMNDIRLYQHSKKDMMSRRPRRAAVSMTAEDYEDPQVCAVSSKLDELAVMRKQLTDLTTMMAKMSTYRPMPPRRRFPTRRPQSGCFNCGERNHFARECPHPEKKTPLNPRGSEQTADTRPKTEADK